MSDNETIVETPDDLSEFEDLFYGRATPKEEVEEIEEVEDETEDEESEVDDAEATDEEVDEADPDESDEDEDEDEKPRRRNRKPAKERIREQTATIKNLERELETLRRIKELEEKSTPEVSEQKQVEEAKAPDPDAKDDKGESLYPLGEFDPAYIRALTRFTIDQETARAEKILEEKRQQTEANQAREKQQEAWIDRLEKAEQELPDVREKIATLDVLFVDIDKGYGQYLVDIVQSLDNGPAILHYLADNPKEAKSIVNSGATSATLSLGRLDAQLAAEKQRKDKVTKVSQAAEPPKRTPRGSGGKFTVPDDTDDLDAFADKFFKKK
jgi:hypothetical protein